MHWSQDIAVLADRALGIPAVLHARQNAARRAEVGEGQATDLREANASALCFQDANRARPSLWRRRLRIRVSGGKAVRLAGKLFSEALERVSQMVDPTLRSSISRPKDPQQVEIAGT